MSDTVSPDIIETGSSMPTLDGVEVLSESENLKPENFSAQAEDIFATLREAAVRNTPKQEAFRRATESYIDDAESLAMRQQAEVILAAPLAAAAQREIVRLKAGYKQSPSGTLREKINDLRTSLCSYNHLVRDLVWQNPGMFTREQLVGWVAKASGAEAWAKQMVSGVAGEVAAAEALAQTPGVSLVEFGTVDDDLHGVDLKLTTRTGVTRSIDLKYGESQPRSGSERRGGVIVLGIEADMIEGFVVRPERRQDFIDTYNSAL